MLQGGSGCSSSSLQVSFTFCRDGAVVAEEMAYLLLYSVGLFYVALTPLQPDPFIL